MILRNLLRSCLVYRSCRPGSSVQVMCSAVLTSLCRSFRSMPVQISYRWWSSLSEGSLGFLGRNDLKRLRAVESLLDLPDFSSRVARQCQVVVEVDR